MAILTYSKFFYGWTITKDNQYLNFSEGGPELVATLALGAYSFADFAAEIVRAMREAGALTYLVAYGVDDRSIEISAESNFELLVSSGTQIGQGVFGLMGFTGADLTGDDLYTGNLASGFEYIVQFPLQSYVKPDQLQGRIDASVNKSTSGEIEVVSFGTEKFMEAEILFITNRLMPSGTLIRSNATGFDDFIAFMQYAITKAPLDFFEDKDDTENTQIFILESTEESKDGVAYRAVEEYAKNLPGYFRSGKLVFRLIE